jgi:hypothetical protein
MPRLKYNKNNNNFKFKRLIKFKINQKVTIITLSLIVLGIENDIFIVF